MSGGLAPLRRAASILRIAGKQLRKEPRKARLIVALVALPSTVLMLIGTVYASQNPTTDELLAAELGRAEAWVEAVAPDGARVVQDPATGEYQGVQDDGDVADDNRPYAEVGALLPEGTFVLTLDRDSAVIDTGTRAATVEATIGRAWDPLLAGKYSVIEGTTPSGPGEVMLSPSVAQRLDVRVGDTVAVGRPAHDVTVVGLLGGRENSWSGGVFGVPEDLGVTGDPSSRFWYLGGTPLTTAQAIDLNTHGLRVYSRQAVESARSEGPMGSGGAVFADALGNMGIASTMGVGAFEMLLLAGAGFAVSMRSNQRNVAMLAATGAPRGTLVSVGVATGVWLGLAGGVIGVVLGTGLGLGWTWLQVRMGTDAVWGYHVVPGYAVGTVVFAVVVSALSALLPALLASRLDVVAALRGSQRPSRPRRWPTFVGAALAVASVALFLWASRVHEHSWDLLRDAGRGERERASSISIAAVVVGLVGASLVVPVVLRGVARAVAVLGVAPRIAARDAARHVARTVPVIAAIATSVVLATLGAVTADHAVRMASNQPQRVEGAGYVQLRLGPADPAMASEALEVEQEVVATVPDAQVVTISSLEEQYSEITGDYIATLSMPLANVCPEWLGEAMTERQRRDDARCSDGDHEGIVASGIAVGGLPQLEALLGRAPSSAELDALAGGDVILFGPRYLEDGAATFALWESAEDIYSGGDSYVSNVPAREIVVPATVAEPVGLSAQGFTAVVSPAVAAPLDAVVAANRVVVSREGGISQAQEDQIQSALLHIGDLHFYVDRAPADYGLYYALMSLGLVLVIGGVCTAIALALARQEAAHDDATLASLGASPGLTKRVAAWHAGIVVFVAGVIGLALGLGTAWAGLRDVASATLFAPWAWMGAALVGVPILVAAFAWVFTRAPKVIHYRLAA